MAFGCPFTNLRLTDMEAHEMSWQSCLVSTDIDRPCVSLQCVRFHGSKHILGRGGLQTGTPSSTHPWVRSVNGTRDPPISSTCTCILCLLVFSNQSMPLTMLPVDCMTGHFIIPPTKARKRKKSAEEPAKIGRFNTYVLPEPAVDPTNPTIVMGHPPRSCPLVIRP